MTFRLAIFDFDGTLADSLGWFCEALNEIAPDFSFAPLSAETLESLRGADSRAIIAHLGVPMWKVPLMARRMRRIAERDCAMISLFPGVDETLLRLAGAGVRIAIVSSNAEANVRRVLGPKLAGAIAHFACGASLAGKASKFRGVVKRSRIDPARVLCIGDEVRDIEAARAAQLSAAAVAWGYATPAALMAHKPDLMFETMRDIEAAFTARD